MRVGILMGSESDLAVLNEAAKVLDDFAVEYEIQVASAHRTPDKVRDYSRSAAARGLGCIIAGAGGAAHLAGAVAAQTVVPVIGVPISNGPLKGVDALYATVNMPTGIPVATVAIDGGANAALLAVAILAVADEGLKAKLEDYRIDLAAKVEAKNDNLQATLGLGRKGEST